ncbi:SgcJ/EcaC family oxidoreductase [Amycolatopsis sp. DSM 110486]|uniref:YybH family protein n=1 Tax=Amycolatopsis sp. DSM 110486 TaxID=2865832 RepID=UPI0021065AB3|nr:SgcJ/EcaC family oxidoreductase [Amycolatopsis sp. DSM 110486]
MSESAEVKMDYQAVITRVLDAWKDGVDSHRPDRVASCFTEDALFQGAHPGYSLGRKGVEEYYAEQPVGLTVRYEIREIRPLTQDVLSAYVDPVFTRPDGTELRFHLTVILLQQAEGDWLISHYHVSKIVE